MTYEWDDIKRRNNIDKHGVDFAAAYDFEWDTALVDIDVRLDYREERYIALGSISPPSRDGSHLENEWIQDYHAPKSEPTGGPPI